MTMEPALGRETVRIQLLPDAVYALSTQQVLSACGPGIGDTDSKAVEVPGITACYYHFWNKLWSTSVGWPTNRAGSLDQLAGFEFDSGQYGSDNRHCAPYPCLQIGSGFMSGNLEAVDARREGDRRVQVCCKHELCFDFQAKRRPRGQTL